MTEAELDSIQRRAEAELAKYQMVDLGDGVRVFSGRKTPDPALQIALDCLYLVRWTRLLDAKIRNVPLVAQQ